MYLRALHEMFCRREHFGPILATRMYFTSAKRGLKLQIFFFFFFFFPTWSIKWFRKKKSRSISEHEMSVMCPAFYQYFCEQFCWENMGFPMKILLREAAVHCSIIKIFLGEKCQNSTWKTIKLKLQYLENIIIWKD